MSKPRRRAEEDVGGADYVERMLALGPREGEPFISFRRRIGAIVEARRWWRLASKIAGGHLAHCYILLGLLEDGGNACNYRLGSGITRELIKIWGREPLTETDRSDAEAAGWLSHGSNEKPSS